MVATSRTSIRGVSPEKSISLENHNLLDSVMESLSSIREMSHSTFHVMSEFIQMQKMHSIEYFARGLAHDLNSGLTVLQSQIYLLEKSVNDPELLGRVGMIRKVSENLEGLVNRLTIIGPEELPEDLAHRDLSVEAKLSMDAMVSSLLPGIRLHFSALSKPLPVLLCLGDVWRVLSNLVKNAQEAMPEGGDLLVGVKRVEVDREYCRRHGNARRGAYAMLSVSDHGEGIAPELQSRIFDPMFTTKEGDGDSGKKEERGWGLAIVYSLVSQRGGWIDVQSKEGQGTTFEVFFPISGENLNMEQKDG